MKQMTCAQMGGPATCDFAVSGESAEEMATKGTEHVMASHPEIAEQMAGMSQEEKDAWMADFSAKFATAPEMQS